ncbi:MAG TPA: flippase [Steroidobacteraceae bacterium]|nr:flippase [Steroidobacteraceae bacterium]
MLAATLSALFRRRLVSNALSLYAVQGLNYLTPLLVLPFVLRALGPEGYGSIVLAQALLGYAAILTNFGFNFTAARDISVARRDPQEIARVYWTTMVAKGLLLLLSFVLLLIIVLVTPAFRSHWSVYLACSVLIVGEFAFPQWYFQGLERLKEVALVQAISKVATAGATVALVRSPSDVTLAALLTSAPQLVGVVVAMLLGQAIAPASLHVPNGAEIRAALGKSWHMFASSVATMLYLNTNAFVLGLMCSATAVAEYGLANRLVSMLQGISAPTTQAVFPRASLLFAEQPGAAWVLIWRVAKVLLPLIGGASLLLGVFAPQVVGFLGGSAYEGAVPAVRIMLLNPVLIAAAGIPAQIIMINTGLTSQMLRIYLSVGLVNLVLLPMLVENFAANGAAVSLTIAETLACSLLAGTVWKHRVRLGLSAAQVRKGSAR